jgi:hypothetical protein
MNLNAGMVWNGVGPREQADFTSQRIKEVSIRSGMRKNITTLFLPPKEAS